MDVFRTPDERFDGLPGYEFAPHYAEVNGLRLHYLDEGDGPPVVCFHGEPTWSYLYRKMLPPLVARRSRVICPDYPGFGRSDKPTDRDWYTYDRHVELMSALLEELDVRDATWSSRTGAARSDCAGPTRMPTASPAGDHEHRSLRGPGERGVHGVANFAERNPDLPVGFVIQGATATDVPPDEVVRAYEALWPTPDPRPASPSFP